jgi:Zn-dependent alcohol dehydrogenase
MIEKKQINLKPIITHNFTLDEINKAYKLAMKGEALKISIKPN